MARKVEVLRGEDPRRTVQTVLVVDGPVSKEVKASGYFYKAIEAQDMSRCDSPYIVFFINHRLKIVPKHLCGFRSQKCCGID